MKLKNFILFVLIFFLSFNNFIFSKNLVNKLEQNKNTQKTEKKYKITSILTIPEEKHKRIRIILNNYLVIENIKYYNDGTIEFPSYESKNNSKYEQIIFLDRNLEKYLISMIKNDKEENYNFNASNVKYEIKNIFKLDTKSSRLANVELILDDKVLIILGVMKGKKGKPNWISYPTEKIDNSYHKQIYFLNNKLKEKIEKDILKEFVKVNKNN